MFDDVTLVCAVTLAFGLGISSVEGIKHLDRADTPRLARALAHLAEELNHTPPLIPGDHRPITYHIAEPKH